MLDSSQSVAAAYRYAPFGKLLAKTGSLTQPFGFSTKRYDEQTGLIYYGYRFYGPEIGRWTTRDPLGEAGGMNLYAFVGNNPVNWVDPWGEAALEATLGWIGGDVVVPEPTDLAWPKWVGYALAIGGAAAIDWIFFNEEDSCPTEGEETSKKERSEYPPAKRRQFDSKKDAREAAKRAGGGKEPIHHPHGKHGPHYHPDVPMPKPDKVTPKMPNPHDHYYYPKSKL